MQIVIDVEDRYSGFVVDLLSNLKQNVIKNITLQKTPTKNQSKLDRFRELRAKSNNKTPLTMEMATNTDEMVNDGIF